ncbi:MAG TPA: efflux RND transporter permease subunit, partial [Gemmatimonadaceae bacterium]
MSQQPQSHHPPVDVDTHEIKYFFIRRPVLGSVISIVITLLGLFAIRLLPIARYPQITPPAVRISTNYPGAAAEDAAQAIAAPIEQQLAGLQGLLYYSSSNSSDGTTNISVTFDISRNQDLAAVDVQNAEKLAEPQLPEAVRTNGVTILKANSDILAVVALRSSDPRYDATYLANYMKLNVIDELKRVPGVGDATPFPARDFAMRLELNPEKMAQLGITVSDVAAAVREQNATNPAGRLGAEPSPVGTPLTLPITTLGRLTTTKEFNDIIVRARPDGSIVRISDIGNATLGAQSYDLVGRLNGKRTAFALLYSRPGANALDVKKAVVARLDDMQKTFPQGVSYAVPFDTTPFVSASIEEVAITLVEAMALVTLVVFLFLQSWRATLIPMLAVPVSVIGTFLGLLVFGMSINVLTLFGLVLAIGIVVDDAIVVIENVERVIEEEPELSVPEATKKAMAEITAPIIAITLVLLSVFVPVAFIPGISGQLFRQFAVAVSVSMLISAVNALTLSPALCAVLLKRGGGTRRGPMRYVLGGIDKVRDGYVAIVRRLAPVAILGVVAVIAVLAGAVGLFDITPKSFLPEEDQGAIFAALRLPEGASINRTEAVVKEVENIVRPIPGV